MVGDCFMINHVFVTVELEVFLNIYLCIHIIIKHVNSTVHWWIALLFVLTKSMLLMFFFSFRLSLLHFYKTILWLISHCALMIVADHGV